jgi:hypothetical protein
MNAQLYYALKRLAVCGLLIGFMLVTDRSIHAQGCVPGPWNCPSPNQQFVNTPSEIQLDLYTSRVIRITSTIFDPVCLNPLMGLPQTIIYKFTLYPPRDLEISPNAPQENRIYFIPSTNTFIGYTVWTVYPLGLGDFEFAVLVEAFLDNCLLSTGTGSSLVHVRDAIDQDARQAERSKMASSAISNLVTVITGMVGIALTVTVIMMNRDQLKQKLLERKRARKNQATNKNGKGKSSARERSKSSRPGQGKLYSQRPIKPHRNKRF